MKKRLCSGVAGIALAGIFLFAAPANAATEFGSNCTAEEALGGTALVSLSHGPTSPLPIAAPTSGVITRWKTTVGFEVPPEASAIYAQRMQVLRSTSLPSQFLVVGESTPGAISTGVNSFPTRVPIQAGDRLGLRGPFVSVYCIPGGTADVVGLAETEGGTPVGSAFNVTPVPTIQVPLAAVIEPDADNDSYGDETQDGCPQSAAYQTPCPVITLATFSQAGSKAVTVSVTTSLSAPVTVSGSVKLNKKTTAKLKAVTAGVTPGGIGKFKLQFPSSLQKRLNELTPKQKLTLKLTASAANIAGPASTSSINAKLKGQG
ncbi:MAG TPA: hypothetical protein VFX45_12305 [Solirubrobacterales bacterium]|nr:hypothetical protein [Solirubrobacterales bacterium]